MRLAATNRLSAIDNRLCSACPRRCGGDRAIGVGFCGADERLRITSVCLHRGEEPPISGSRGAINVFFAGCNLRCAYCQNYQISRREAVAETREWSLEEVTRRVAELAEQGGHCLNLVSPSHVTDRVVAIVESVRRAGMRLPVVYNTNAYDSPESLRRLDGLVDVYLPDLKYALPELGRDLSLSVDYVAVALAALEDMRRQAGCGLELDEAGLARRGIIVRHLVLPDHLDNSLRALELIAQILTPAVHLSLMCQYNPIGEIPGHPELSRRVSQFEYDVVCEKAYELGFENGWFQEPDSPEHYRPDFAREHPFESGEE